MAQPLPGPPFTTFHASHEPTLAPHVVRLTRLAHTWTQDRLAPAQETVISVRHLDRVLITAQGADLARLDRQDLLEVVDYDPARRVCLVMGPAEPPLAAPLHFLLMRQRPEVGATLQIPLPEDTANPHLVTTPKKAPAGTLEEAKQALAATRTARTVRLRDDGVLLLAKDLDALDRSLREFRQDP